MKTFLSLSLLVASSLHGQEFYPPTEVNLMNISLNFLEDSKNTMSVGPEKDCETKEEKLAATEIKKPEQAQEIVCLCDLGNLAPKDRSIVAALIGDIESSEFTLNTGNDNLLHGIARTLGEGIQTYDGDDRGRTFSGSIDYSLMGREGELNIKLESVGFGKFTTVDGYRKDKDEKFNLNFREQNTLSLRHDHYLSKNEKEKLFFINEFKFTNETDAGNISRSIQEWWHSNAKHNLGFDMIQYKYIVEEEDKNTVTLMSGIGKEWIQNIGNWKCQTRAEIKGGMSLDFKGTLTPEIAAGVSNRLTHSSLPWVALSTWIQGSREFSGPSVEGGVMLSFEKKVKNTIIRPFIGVETHRTTMDKSFGSVSGKPYELYHVLGVTIKY